MQKSTYILYTDGSCLKNPGGSGGYGVILINISTGELINKSEGFFSTTNNRMEVMAAIEGLGMVPQGAEVELVSDSQYLVRTLQGAFAKKKNHDLWAALDRAMAGKSVNVRWVRGHASDPYNNRCDQMAVQAAYSRLGKIWDTRAASLHQKRQTAQQLPPVHTAPPAHRMPRPGTASLHQAAMPATRVQGGKSASRA